MQIENILAATLKLDIDYSLITKEILDCQKFFVYTPPYDINLQSALESNSFMVEPTDVYNSVDYIEESTGKLIKRKIRGPHIFYLTRHIYENMFDSNRLKYSTTKKIDHKEWIWRAELLDKIPYTMDVIKSLPFYKTIGCVRTFIMTDTFLATHRDYGWGLDDSVIDQNISRCLGLSLIPSTGNVPMKILCPRTNNVISVPGNAMLFNDSYWHGVPITSGHRITIRIFGDVDFDLFENYLDQKNTFYK